MLDTYTFRAPATYSHHGKWYVTWFDARGKRHQEHFSLKCRAGRCFLLRFLGDLVALAMVVWEEWIR